MNDNESYCTFTVCGATCGVPVSRVREIVCDQPITPVPLAKSSVRGLINLRGQILTAIDIGQLMGLSATGSTATHGRYHVIAQLDDELVSVTVDEMGPIVTPNADEMEQPPHNLDPSVARLIVAAARLPDRVLLVLDLDRVMAMQAGAAT